MNAVALKKALVTLQIKETLIVLAASVMLPFVIHLVPAYGEVPLGARILAMFYAPFIAVILFRPHVAILTGLLSPTLNALLTGYPRGEMIVLVTLELAIFSIIAALVYQRWKNFWGAAPVAYSMSLCIASLLIVPHLFPQISGLSFFMHTLSHARVGMVILLLINIILVRFRPHQ